MRATNLTQARLTKANLQRADLSNADADRAVLANACLAGANLTDARLTAADLDSALLVGANLAGTIFEDDFRPASLRGTAFFEAHATESTRWPRDDTEPTQRLSSQPPASSFDPLKPPAEAHSDRVVAVEDGDTVELANWGAARLVGVNAPDPDERKGLAARDYAEHVLKDKRVVATLGLDREDAAGRKTVYLWLLNGESFNQNLLAQGYATLSTADAFAADQLKAAAVSAGQRGVAFNCQAP
jgi:uncharacterized protein YjbI with pentapeptide repeats